MPPFKKFRADLAHLWKRLTGDWHLLQDTPLSPEEMRDMFSQSNLPIFHYYILLIFATAITTLGLLTDSAATIIGGMLLAPLMTPVMSLGYSVTSFEAKLVHRALFAIITGIFLVIAIAFLTTAFLGLRLVNPEIVSRTNPNLLDLGVAIAAGAAGAFAWTRPRIANAIPGVAIAVALVPPLCVVGVALASGSANAYLLPNTAAGPKLATGAFLLFAANVLGIIFSAGIVFLLHGYGKLHKGMTGMGLLTLAVLLITWPLDFSFRNLYAKSSVSHSIENLAKKDAGLFDGLSEVLSVNIVYARDAYHLEFDIIVPKDELGDIQQKLNAFSEALSKDLDHPVHARVRAIPADFFFSSPSTNSSRDANTN
ncbi:MAG: DUF389 domain-containing protein [Verrucomicrobiota bacterium]